MRYSTRWPGFRGKLAAAGSEFDKHFIGKGPICIARGSVMVAHLFPCVCSHYRM